jgi:peptide/nickel transport system permease protein
VSLAVSPEAVTQELAGATQAGQSLGRSWLRYALRNRQLIMGLALLGVLALFVILGNLLYDTSRFRPLSVPAGRPPGPGLPFGSDAQGRDLMAVMIAGTPLTLYIGLLAGFLGVMVGTILAFTSAYYGGAYDAVVRSVVDVGLTVPGLLVLVILAVSLKTAMSVEMMALVVAALAWLWPARTIRSQVLTMRERAYVQVARLSGMSGMKIILFEMIPNLLPYLAASLVAAVSSAILASIGLEALGLGATEAPTIGMTIFWVIFYGALLQGMWWWFVPPIIVIVILFMGLFGLSAGLDEIANPRLRKTV